MTDMELVSIAIEARKKAYAPYSKFLVGAALLDSDGNVYRGCNIENAAYGPSNCAERTAFFKAISEGIRSFRAIAIVGGPEEKGPVEFCAPCGVCRQVMMEFCDYDSFRIVLGRSAEGETACKAYTLKELFPEGFGPKDL